MNTSEPGGNPDEPDVDELGVPIPPEGTYATGLAPIGSLFAAAGLRRHIAKTWRGAWIVLARDVHGEDAIELTFQRSAAEAAKAMFHARLNNCPEGSVIEVCKATLGAWRLIDRAPAIRFTNVADEDKGMEYVWGPNGSRIGVLHALKPRIWELLTAPNEGGPSTETEDILYKRPPHLNDAMHGTRVDAIRAAERLPTASQIPAGDDWPVRWGDTVSRFADAGIAATFKVDILLLGATGAICTAPGCDREAYTRLTATGTDIGTERRMACFRHGGEALARQTHNPGS